MLLKKVTITNFLSITGSIDFDLDRNVTILLGANDHGKSNILKALLCLNDDTPISKDDENWDATTPARLRFDFALNDAEADELGIAIALAQEDSTPTSAPAATESTEKLATPAPAAAESAEKVAPPASLPAVAIPADLPEENHDEMVDVSDPTAIKRRLSAFQASLADGGTVEFSLIRTGAAGPLCFRGIPIGQLPSEVRTTLQKGLPRVELFQGSSGELQDSVTAAQVKTQTFEFLQGIFFYAGLDPMNADALFTQDDRTERALDEASKTLDAELRRLWVQGVDLDLHFELRHRQAAIEFLANDPAVKNRKARMSKRSAGVTQFFRLSMVLHARRKKHPANSYIYLFDEPGVFLHPKGQKDLIQVFEQLSGEAQIIYATHSLFMLNQNFPERHRLIIRDAHGTKVDQKPYRANWRLATDALGVHLTANILFSPAVLLVEGDSDPLYIYEMLRQLNHAGLVDADANMLGILSYSDLPNLRFLLQTFKSDNKDANVLVLCDGDNQGKRIRDAIKSLCERLQVECIRLRQDNSIEDYALYPDTFLKAVEDSIRGACEAEQFPVPPELTAQLATKWEEHQRNKSDTTGKWFKDTCKAMLNKQEASKVALARNYAFRCREEKETAVLQQRSEAALELANQIIKGLKLPSIKAPKTIEDEPSLGL